MSGLHLIDRAQVARKLGITVEKFYCRYAALRAHPVNPFPSPVLGDRAGSRWNPAEIDAWIIAGGERATLPPAGQNADMAGDIDNDTAARLDRKAARKKAARELAAQS